jgi:hypothetical protein
MTTAQLALDIPAPQPPPAAFLRVDEIGVALHAPRETRMLWELYRLRHATRLTTIAVRMPGDLIDIACDDRAHAQWLADWLYSLGVPKASLKVHGGASVIVEASAP